MPKLNQFKSDKNLLPQTKHFILSPHLFRQQFYRHYSIRIILGNCSLAFEKQPFNRAILQNHIKGIKGFTISTSPNFVFVTDMF